MRHGSLAEFDYWFSVCVCPQHDEVAAITGLNPLTFLQIEGVVKNTAY